MSSLKSNRVVEVPFKPHVINLLSVSSNKGKRRLIVYLRNINNHLEKRKVKFEDWKVFQNYLFLENFLFKFDLKSGYHHVEIYKPHHTYLGFQWEIDGVTRYFCFAVLLFGLSTAPFIFTKVRRPLVKWWRFHGTRIVLYLDDNFSTAPSRLQNLKNSVLFNNSLIKAGFLPNGEKSVWIPAQICEWLGIIINAVDKTIITRRQNPITSLLYRKCT